MKNLFKEKFALTEQGAKDLVKASIVTFLNYVINMVPAMLLMLVFDQLVLGNVRSKLFISEFPFLY